MKFIETLYDQLRNHPKRIVFTEGAELRVIQAAAQFAHENLGTPLLLGKTEEILAQAKNQNLDLKQTEIIDPDESSELKNYIDQLCGIFRFKDINEHEARKIVTQTNYFGAMMLRNGIADGLVGGATSVSGSILRPLFQLVKPPRGASFISSCMVVEVPHSTYGDNGLFIFADCGVVPNPTPMQLASIAIEAAKLSHRFFQTTPRVAMLSYSTKGSALTEDTEKMIKATLIAKQQLEEQQLQFEIDGELQVDTALVREVAELKAPGSLVAGRANVLIFPDLNSGNIALKLVQRLGQASAYGQILMGLSRPAADLSRGASTEEILGIAALTSLQETSN